MENFYFTYGTNEKMPFRGGWTQVIAHNADEAFRLFNAVHLPRHEGITNCASIYTEEEFKRTIMYEKGNNLGKALCEIISVKTIYK